MDAKPADGKKAILVNGKKIYIEKDALTAKEILERAELDPNQYDLYLVTGQTSKKLEPGTLVEIKNDQHFNAIINNAVYG